MLLHVSDSGAHQRKPTFLFGGFSLLPTTILNHVGAIIDTHIKVRVIQVCNVMGICQRRQTTTSSKPTIVIGVWKAVWHKTMKREKNGRAIYAYPGRSKHSILSVGVSVCLSHHHRCIYRHAISHSHITLQIGAVLPENSQGYEYLIKMEDFWNKIPLILASSPPTNCATHGYL